MARSVSVTRTTAETAATSSGVLYPASPWARDAALERSRAAQPVCAILDDQRIECWGTNVRGQLGLGDRISAAVFQDRREIPFAPSISGPG
jgi:hypothetical protein